MSRARNRLWSVLVPLCAALGCADQQPPPPQPAFERPGDVAFVCLGEEGDRHVAYSFDANGDALSPCAIRTPNSDIFQMHALVTQTTRGEVAVVALEDGEKLDARRDIPGFTFVPVGEFPSAIVVPNNQPPDMNEPAPPTEEQDHPSHPGIAYVANFGSRDIYALDISTMIDLNAGESAVLQVVPVHVPMGADSVRGGPFDMVVSPSGDALLVSVPELSAVLRMPIRNCVPPETECILTDQIQVIPMGESLKRTLATPAPPDGPEPYQLLCGDFVSVTPPPATPPELPDDLLSREARPSALAVDAFCAADDSACPRRLLVADAELPLLHVIDLNAFDAGMLADPASALLDPWVSGATTSDVAVTPRVPRSLDTLGDDTQYVYAIDSVDGSVLVMQDGALLHPNGDAGQRFDRVPLGKTTQNAFGDPRAVAIEVATPGFDDTGAGDQYLPASECSVNESNGHSDPRDLHGVFLSVATADGTILMVDVHDMELGAPPKEKGAKITPRACRACPPGDAPLLTRHHLRLSNTYEKAAEDGVDPLTAPGAAAKIVLEGRVYDVRSDGTTTNPTLPELACQACEPPLMQAFPGQVVVDAGTPMASVDAGADGSSASADGSFANADGSFASADGSFASADASFADAGPAVDAGPPGIDQAEACPADAPALICGLGDPWVSMDRFWELAYEGPIPLENGEFIGHRGQFRPPPTPGAPDAGAEAMGNVSNNLEFISEIEFCTSGILGDDDAPEGMRGDALVITSPLPDPDKYDHCTSGSDPDECFTDKQLEECAALRKALDDDPEYQMRFAIRRAYQDYLVLEHQTIDRSEDLSPRYDLIVKCMDERLMEFQVTTHEAFTVHGLNGTGFESPVVPSGGSGRCVRDPAADPLQQGRAVVSELPPAEPRRFRNRFFEITILPPRAGGATAAGTRISLEIVPSSLSVLYDATPPGIEDPSVVPVELRYLDIEERLFLIDAHQLGLVPIRLDPFPDHSNTRYN